MLKSTKHDRDNVKKNSKIVNFPISHILFPKDFSFCALVLTSESYSYIIKSLTVFKNLGFLSPVNNPDEQSTSLGEFSYVVAGMASTQEVCTQNYIFDGLCLYT